MSDLSRLMRYARPHTPVLMLGILLTAVVGFFEAARIALIQPIIDGLIGSQTTIIPHLFTGYIPQSFNNLQFIALLMIILTILKGLAFFFSGYFLTSVGQKVIVTLRQQLFDHFLKQSAPFFLRHKTTDLSSHIISDVERVQHAVTVLLADTLRESFTLVALLIYIFWASWKLAIFSLFIAPLIYGLTVKFGKRLRRTSHNTQEGIQEVLGIAQEALSGNRIVKAFGMEKFEEQRFNKALTKLQRTNMRTARALYLSSPILELVGFLLLPALILYAQSLINQGVLTLGSFAGLLGALFKLYDPMRKLSQTQNNYQQIFAASSRVFALLDEHTELIDRPDARKLDNFQKSIELKKLSFHYGDSQKLALDNINLTIKKGEMVALVGKSGSGKTTLTNLLFRFFELTSGQIFLDDIEIRDLTLASLRAQLSLVSQEIILFNDTIHNNIAYGCNLSRAQVEAAARSACAHEFIMARGGYDVMVAENGKDFSGGQKQRLAIARAILKDAPILILDEATSNLDTESETQFQHALTNLMQHRTTLVIAHRLSTIRRASRIVVMDQGHIVEEGTHEELLAKGGLYQNLYELQFADDETMLVTVDQEVENA